MEHHVPRAQTAFKTSPHGQSRRDAARRGFPGFGSVVVVAVTALCRIHVVQLFCNVVFGALHAHACHDGFAGSEVIRKARRQEEEEDKVLLFPQSGLVCVLC